MKVLKTKKIEGCLEGTNVRDLLLNSKITETLVNYLVNDGKLILHKDMEKPFFKIIVRGKYTLKGTLGNDSMRVVFPLEGYERHLEDIIKQIEAAD